MPNPNFEQNLKQYEPYILGVLGIIACAWFGGAMLFQLVGADVMESRPWTLIQYAEYYSLTIYWISVVAAVVPPIAFLAIKFMPTPEKLHGDARWASESDLKKSKLRSVGGIILGTQKGRYLSTVEPAHFMVCAPTRSGKGVGIIVPNLLDWNGSVIVHDIKFENWKLTSGVRAAHGHKVFLWSPMNPDATTHSYNPLDMIRDDAIFRISDVQAFVSYMIPLPKKDPIWDQLARFFLAGLVLYTIDANRELGTPKTIGQIYRLLNSYPDLNKWITEVSEYPWLDPECDRLLTSYAGMTDKERSFVRTSIAKVLNLWSNPLVDAATSKSDFDLRDMRKKKMSIYVGVSVDTKDTVAPLVALFMQQAIGALVQREPDKKTEPTLVLFMLDEFASMGRMEMVSNSVTMLASYGGRLMFILQALSTLDEHYGKDGREVILQNCAYQVFFAASDETTTKYVVNRLGKKTVKTKQISRSKSGVSKADKMSARDLMLPQEFQGLDRSKEVILVESGRPVLADKIKYFEEDAFTERLMAPADVPTISVPENYRSKPTPVADVERPGEPSRGADALLYGTTPEPLPPKTDTPEPVQKAPETAPVEEADDTMVSDGSAQEEIAAAMAAVDEESAGTPAVPAVETPPETTLAAPAEGASEAIVSDDAEDDLFDLAMGGETVDVPDATDNAETAVSTAVNDGSEADRRDKLADDLRAAAKGIDPAVATAAAERLVADREKREAETAQPENSEDEKWRDRQYALFETYEDDTSTFNIALSLFGKIGNSKNEDERAAILAQSM